MARSSGVWVVWQKSHPTYIHATFTVKHECVTWLRRVTTPHCDWKICKLPDGAPGHRAQPHEWMKVTDWLAQQN